jgi:hypothetical protein
VKLTTTTAAAALGVSVKTLDNILARKPRTLTPAGRRGRSRHLPLHVLEHVAVAMLLNRDLGSPLPRSLQLAGALIQGRGRHPVGAIGALHFDLASLRTSLALAVATALEEAPLAPRGRPPRRTKNKRGAFPGRRPAW